MELFVVDLRFLGLAVGYLNISSAHTMTQKQLRPVILMRELTCRMEKES